EGKGAARFHRGNRRAPSPRMNGHLPDRRTVGGVIVTYFPDPEFPGRLAAIAGEVGSLVVVDNSATPEVAQRLRPLCAAAGAELIVSATNVGLGAALNTAFRRFEKRGTNWIVAFDQDSTPAAGFVPALLGAASAPEVAIVG